MVAVVRRLQLQLPHQKAEGNAGRATNDLVPEQDGLDYDCVYCDYVYVNCLNL